MKVLMFLRESLPALCVDVDILFDKELRQLGIATEYVGSRSADAATARAMRGAVHVVPGRGHPCAWFAELRTAWRELAHVDLLLVRDKPISVLWLYPIAALRGRPVGYWMSFPIPLGDRTAASLHARQGRPLRAIVTGLRGWAGAVIQQRVALPRAGHVFVQSQAMRSHVLAATPGLSAHRVTAVPMGVDTAALRTALTTSTSVEPLAADASWVVYVGSLDGARRLEVLIDALAVVRRQWPATCLVLIGSASRDSDVQRLRDHAARQGLAPSLRFTGRLAMADALALARTAAVAVSPIPPGALFDVSSPTKMVEYLALGLPVVATPIPDQLDLLQRFGGGRCVSFDAASIAAGIVDLLADLENARRAARVAGENVLAERAYPVLARQVDAALRALAGPRLSDRPLDERSAPRSAPPQ